MAVLDRWELHFRKTGRGQCTGLWIMYPVLFLIVVTINGYSAIFFAISNDFSNQIVSKPAFPFWSALGQIGSIIILYFSPVLFENPADFFIMLGVVSGFAITFTVISAGAAYVNGFTSKEPIETAASSHDLPSFLKKLSDIYESWFDAGIAYLVFFAAIYSFSLFSLKFAGHYWFSNLPDDLDENSFNYDGSFDVALRGRLYQQIVQIFCSIVFSVIEYIIVRYEVVEKFCIRKHSKKPVNYSYTDPRSSFHVNPQPYGILNAQSFTLVLGLIGFPIGSLLLAFGPIENVKVLGFAMTGLGSTILYTSREFQRSFLRVVRLDKHDDLDDKILEDFEFYDRIYGASFFSACLALGELFAILLIRFSPLYVFVAAFCPIIAIISVGFLFNEVHWKHNPRKLEFEKMKSLNNFFAKNIATPSKISFRKQKSMPS